MVKKKISIYLILIILGVVFPFMLENGLNLKENIFLLMHLFVFLTGVTFGAFGGALSGILIPAVYMIFNFSFDNIMLLPLSVFPCICYGGISGYLYLRKKKNIYYSLGVAMLVGRVVYIVLYISSKIVFKKADADNLFLNLIFGVPGVVLQFALVPLFAGIIYKKIYQVSRTILQNSINSLNSDELQLMIVNNNRTVFKTEKQDISEIVRVYDEEPSFYKNAVTIVKDLGKDTALVLALGGVNSVYCKNISKLGLETLKENKIYVKYETVKDVWDDPFEKHIMEIKSPADGYFKIKAKIERENQTDINPMGTDIE